MSGNLLYHNCVSVVVSRFTNFIEDFDQPLSSHPTFLLEVLLRQCAFCKEPLFILVRKQTSQFSAFWEVSINTMLP